MEVVSKSIVMRTGDPVPLIDWESNMIWISFHNQEYKRSSNTYMLNNTDLVFPCFICDYEDFIKNKFSDTLYISSWNLVKEIDSNIYCKTESNDSDNSRKASDAWSTTLEEKWEEIDDFTFETLCFYMKDCVNQNFLHTNLISYIRDRKLKKLL